MLLVNPNDFRDYMVKQVAARAVINCSSTGHCVGTSGRSLVPLRANVSHRPGRKPATGSRHNMRLDVALLPLLSHQLSVKR